jgi:hypothetical protein
MPSDQSKWLGFFLCCHLFLCIRMLGSQLSRKALWMGKMHSESLAVYSVRLALLELRSTGVPGIFEWTRAQVPLWSGVGGKILSDPGTGAGRFIGSRWGRDCETTVLLYSTTL